MEKSKIYARKPVSLSQADNYNFQLMTGPEDLHFEETIIDMIAKFSNDEICQNPWLPSYIRELIGRWGRWTIRGRAPSACFEAACAGGRRFLQKSGISVNDLSSKAEILLAVTLAGVIVDAVEPDAADGPIRNKAIQIVADEFLAKAISPDLSIPAKRRIKSRKTILPDKDTEGDDRDSSDEAFSPFAPSIGRRTPSFVPIPHQTRTYRSPSLPNAVLEPSIRQESLDHIVFGSSYARTRSSSTNSKHDFPPRNRQTSDTPIPTKFSDLLNSVLNEVETYIDNLSEKSGGGDSV